MKKVLFIAVLVLSFLLPNAGTTVQAQNAVLDLSSPNQYIGRDAINVEKIFNRSASQAMIGTTVTINSSLNPAQLTQSITLSSRVVENNILTPTGTITFYDGQEPLTTVAINSSGWAYFSTSTLPLGSHTLTAVYSGDENFSGNTSTPYFQEIEKISSIITINQVDPYPTVVGQALTVYVSARAMTGFSGVPSGIITVSSDGHSCDAILSGGSGNCKITYTSIGTKTISISYAGDARFKPATYAGYEHQVNISNTNTIIESITPAAPSLGQTVTVNVLIQAASPGGGIPSGTVDVTGTTGERCLVQSLDVNGRGSCTFRTVAVGDRLVWARYYATENYNTSIGKMPLTVTIGKTTTSITAQTPSSVNLNQAAQAYFTVQRSDPASASPSGSVRVFLDGTLACGPVTLPASGSGSCSFTATSAGSKALTAVYSGDGNFEGSTSTAFPIEVNKISTSTVIESVSPSPSFLNDAVTVTFRMIPAAQTLSPTSTVTILDGSAPFCTAPVAAGSCTGSFTTLGVKLLTAHYSGDDTYQESTSEAVAHTVNGQNTYADPALDCADHLPCYATIQQAIDEVSPGYSVTVYAGEYAESVSLEKEAVVSLLGEVHINGALSISAGIWNSTPDLLVLEGDLTQTGGTFNNNSGTLEMAGESSQQITLADPLNHLLINNSTGSVSLGGPLDINGNLSLISGALDVSANSYAIHLSGDWQRGAGTFIARTGTLTLDGSSQTLSGSNTFSNLTRHTPGSLVFSAGQTQTITTTLDLQGAEESPLFLRSSTPGSTWQIDPQAARMLAYLDVQDSTNINALRIDSISGENHSSGNNSGWNFFAPVINAQSSPVTESQDQILTIAASDGDQDSLTLTILTLPVYGTLYQYDGSGRGAPVTSESPQVTDPNFRLVYAFAQDGPAQDTFEVRASDGMTEDTAIFTLNRMMINDAPTITSPGNQEMLEDGALGPLAFEVADEETPSLDLTVSVSSSNSTLVPQSGLSLSEEGTSRTLTIAPAGNQHGETTITLSVSDGSGDPVTTSFNVSVIAVNDTPDAQDAAVRLDEDSSYTFVVDDFPFTDPADHDTFAGIRVTETVPHGSLEADAVDIVNGDVIADVSKLIFTPASDAAGDNYASFKFQVRDSAGGFSPEYIMTLNVTQINDAPVAEGESYDTNEDTPLSITLDRSVLENDSDPESDSLTALVVMQPMKGALTLEEDGTFTYSPRLNENGDDHFTYRAFDGKQSSQPATVTIHIAPQDDLPVLKLDPLLTAQEGQNITFSATYLDPDTNQSGLIGDLVMDWDFGDGTQTVPSALTAAHTFSDDGSYSVTVRVKNAQNQVLATDVGTLTVANVAPQVSAGTDGEITINQVFTRSGSFTDPGTDAWTATVDYGDGAGEQALPLDGKRFTLGYIYTQAGIYTVTIRVQDDGPTPGTAIFQMTVLEKYALSLPMIVR